MTREEIYKEIVSAVKQLHIAFGAGEDKATRIANIHAVKNTNKEFYRRIKERKMKALKILQDCNRRVWDMDECDEAIEEIKTLEKQLEEYDSIVVGLNYKLAKAQSYIVELEDKLRGYIRENGLMNK